MRAMIVRVGILAALGWASGGSARADLTFTTIDYPGARETYVTGINDSGDVVGYYYDSSFTEHGFKEVGGVFTTIDLPGSVGSTFVEGINNAGTIVGYYTGSDGVTDGFTETAAGTVSTLIAPGADNPGAFGNGTYAQGINDAGEVVGFYYATDGSSHTFVYDGSSYTTINAPAAGGTSVHDTDGYGINDSGEVSGRYAQTNLSTAAVSYYGFTYDNGTFTQINHPGPTGLVITNVYGINNAGAVVGWDYSNTGVPSGFIDAGGTFTTLNDPSGHFGTVPLDINNTGEVVGYYEDASQTIHGFLYGPASDEPASAPEPSTFVTAATGAALALGVGWLRRRLRR